MRRDLVGLGLDVGEEVVLGDTAALEKGLDTGDRVLELPVLKVLAEPVAGRVVGSRVGAHPIGIRLDERRAAALASPLHRRLGDRVAGEYVVAVDPDAGEAEAECA